MRYWLRRVKRRSGIAAPRVKVRRHRPWYWRTARILLMLGVGYGAAYWQFVGRHAVPPDSPAARKIEDVQALQAKVAHLESQLQVSMAAQGTLAREMAVMQDENVRMKEDAAFYKSILSESGTAGVPRIHSFKLSKGAHPGEYQYQVLLVQSGRHDKMSQGVLQLMLIGTQDGKPVTQHVEPEGQSRGIKINFKYYQRIEGGFNVPAKTVAQSLQANYVEAGGKQSILSQTASFPN